MVKVPFKWLHALLCVAIVIGSVVIAKETKKAIAAKNKNEKKADPKKEETQKEEAAKEEVKPAETKPDKDEKTETAPKEDEAVAEEPDKEAVEEMVTQEGVQEVEEEAPTEDEAEQPDEEVVAEETGDEVEEEAAEESPAPEADEQEGAGQEGEEEAVAEEEVVEEPEEKEEPPKVELGPNEIMGIDTVDLEDPQGNWLYKRVWWERAEAKYEKIRTAVTSVLEVRTQFFAKRAELDKNVLDPFYIKIGLSQGELQERLSDLIAKQEAGLKDQKSEEILEKLEADKQALEQVQKDVQGIVKQDEEVESAILMLVDQANKMRNYEQQAWQDFKNIARVLDDKKAREMFYKVDGAWRNIQELKQYVESNFSSSFDQLIELVSQKVQMVDSAMQALKEKGIDLKQRVEQEEAEPEEPEAEEEEPPQGIFTRYVVNPVTGVITAVWDIIMWPIRKIMGTADIGEEVAEEQMAAEKQEIEEPEGEPAEVEPTMEPEEEPVVQETIQAVSIPTPPDIAMPTPSKDEQGAEEDEPEAEAVEVDVEEVGEAVEGDEGDEEDEEMVDLGEFGEPMTEELDTTIEEVEEE